MQYHLNTRMGTFPALSVVTASYNVADYVGQAIHSALAQTFRDFELIVIDDGSTDGTLDVVKGIIDPRIRLEPRPHQAADLTFSWSRIIDEFGRDTGLTSRLWKGPISCAQLLADNVIGNGSSPV